MQNIERFLIEHQDFIAESHIAAAGLFPDYGLPVPCRDGKTHILLKLEPFQEDFFSHADFVMMKLYFEMNFDRTVDIILPGQLREWPEVNLHVLKHVTWLLGTDYWRTVGQKSKFANRRQIIDAHDDGSSINQADKTGIYSLLPDGTKEYYDITEDISFIPPVPFALTPLTWTRVKGFVKWA